MLLVIFLRIKGVEGGGFIGFLVFLMIRVVGFIILDWKFVFLFCIFVFIFEEWCIFILVIGRGFFLDGVFFLIFFGVDVVDILWRFWFW